MSGSGHCLIGLLLRKLWSYAAARYGVCVFVAAAFGFAYGKWSTPPRIETRTEIKTVVQQVVRTEYKDRIVVQREKARVVYRDVVRTVVVQPDGTQTTTTADRSRIDTTTTTGTNTTREGGSSTTTQAATQTNAVSITTARPSWRIGVLVGVGIRGPDGLIRTLPIGTLSPSPLGPVLLGLEASGQVLGPWYIGGWGLTNARDIMMGVSTGVSF